MYLQVIDMKLKEKNISARKMLLDLHLSNNLLTKWRNGNIPSLDKITAIAEYLDVPVSYLLGEIQAFETLTDDGQTFLKNYRHLDITCKMISLILKFQLLISMKQAL